MVVSQPMPQPPLPPTPASMMVRETEEALELVATAANAVERRAAAASSEVRTLTRRLSAALAERERELLQRVERVRLAKSNALRQQVSPQGGMCGMFQAN